MNKEAHDKLIKCRSQLMSENIGIASMLLHLKLVEDNSFDTMATDGVHIKYNVDFVLDHSVEEIKGVLVHEACHVIWEHPLRKANRNHKLWNVATDYAINYWLFYELKMALPEGGLIDRKYANKTAEQIYASLMDETQQEFEENKQQDGVNSDPAKENISESVEDKQVLSSPINNSQPEQESSGASATIEDYIEEKFGNSIGEVIEPVNDDGSAVSNEVIEEIRHGIKEVIHNSAKMEALGNDNSMKELIATKKAMALDWTDVLKDLVQSSMSSDKSWAKPDRRSIHRDMYLPSDDSSEISTLAIAIDTSASMSQEELNHIAYEVKALAEELGIQKLKVCYCDSVVRRNPETDEWWDDYDLANDPDFTLKMRGGGYTRFEPVFNLFNDHTEDKEEVEALIYFTDMCGDISADVDPQIPVIWCDTEPNYYSDYKMDVPFGEVVRVNL